MNNCYTKYFVLFLLGIIISVQSHAQRDGEKKTSGFLDFNGYYDTREFSVFTINALAKLPNRFQYFSLTNYQSGQQSSDLISFYSEQNLRWQIKKSFPVDLTFQYVIRQGPENDDFRFGFRWRLHDTPLLKSFFKFLSMSYSINPMLVQFRENTNPQYMTQLEHVYKIRIYKDRVYLAGFADQNFIYNGGVLSFKWVSEHQLGIRIVDQLYAIAEYRINDYLVSDNTGLGLGFQYKIIF